jgi:hypothetical protein
LDPVLFEIPFGDYPIPVHAFGGCLGLGLLVCWYVVVGPPGHPPSRRTRARALVAATGGAVVGGFLGSLFGGGGLSLAVLGAFAFVRFVGTPRVLGPHAGAALGLAVGAWGFGVWLDGAVFGYPLDPDAPLWVRSLGIYGRWEDGSGAPALFAQIGEGWLPHEAGRSLPTHPVGLYYCVLGGAIAVYGVLARGRVTTPWVAVALLAFGRFALDGLRHDLSTVALAAERGLACALLLVAVVGIWLWLVGRAPAPRPQSSTTA